MHRGRPPCLPPEAQESARSVWITQVSKAAPHLAGEGEALLARLSPDRWAVEWSLPYWLGQSMLLPRETWLRLVISNLHGLGFVRLLDDLLDGEADAAAPASVLLGSTLQHLWSNSLRDLLGADARFWSSFDLYLGQWQAATWESLQCTPAPARALTVTDYTTLGHRGAPLKVCIAAACLLGGQAEGLAPLAAAVDSLMTAAVLLDHANDWEEDLIRERPNAFVAHLLAGAPGGDGVASRRTVTAALYAAGGATPYFATARRYLADAVTRAEEGGLAALADYARWVDGLAAHLDRELRRYVRRAYAMAGAQLRMAEA